MALDATLLKRHFWVTHWRGLHHTVTSLQYCSKPPTRLSLHPHRLFHLLPYDSSTLSVAGSRRKQCQPTRGILCLLFLLGTLHNEHSLVHGQHIKPH